MGPTLECIAPHNHQMNGVMVQMLGVNIDRALKFRYAAGFTEESIKLLWIEAVRITNLCTKDFPQQRSGGIPILVFYDKACNIYTYLK